MPLRIVAVAPNRLAYQEYDEEPLAPDQVRVRSGFSAAKMGTESGVYRGTSALAQGYMNEYNIYVPGRSDSVFPFVLGNTTVGWVTETGSQVKRVKVGDRVCLYGDTHATYGFSQTHTAPDEDVLIMPETMTPESAVYLDPGIFALAGIRDGQVGLGDRVAIFGLGAIGQMAVQMARVAGALKVYGVDPLKLRRKMAEQYGADVTVDPAGEPDVGGFIKEATGGQGVDVAIECSGVVAALHQAIRATVKGGRIVTVGCYGGGATDLRLGEDWHRNQQTMVASRGFPSPGHWHPAWTGQRVNETVWELLTSGWLKTVGLVAPVVPFDQAAEAYEKVNKEAGAMIKLAVTY